MKRLICILMVGFILLSLSLIGCGTGNNQENTDQSTTAGQTETDVQSSTESGTANENLLPIVSEPGSVTLHISFLESWAQGDMSQGLPIWKEIEKKTGVIAVFEPIPPNQYDTSMSTRLAAGTNLPDLVIVPGDAGSVVQYGTQGVFLEMNDLIDKYAPNIKKLYEMYPEVKKLSTCPDGKIYSISAVVTGTNTDPYVPFVREGWLKKVGMKEPATTDEWYAMLKAFKDQDANGNSKPDEIPLTVSNGAYYHFGNAFGLRLYFSSGIQPDANGKLQYDWIDTRYKDYLQFLNKLYKEGLFDNEYLKVDRSKCQQKAANDLVGAGYDWSSDMAGYTKAMQQNGINDRYIPVVPPSGPSGEKGYQETYGVVVGYQAITKSCKNPEVMMKWLDYVYASKEGWMYLLLGIEGKSYEMKDGKPSFTEWVTKNPDGMTWQEAVCSLGSMRGVLSVRADKGDPYSWWTLASLACLPPESKMAYEKVQPYLVNPIAKPIISQEDARAMGQSADINTYQEECMAKFVNGQMGFDQWDTYVNTVKSMGLDKVMEIKQKAYDNYLKAN